MNKNNDPRGAYLPPQVEEITLFPMTIIAASGEPNDWNDGGIDDNFNDLFDFDQ